MTMQQPWLPLLWATRLSCPCRASMQAGSLLQAWPCCVQPIWQAMILVFIYSDVPAEGQLGPGQGVEVHGAAVPAAGGECRRHPTQPPPAAEVCGRPVQVLLGRPARCIIDSRVLPPMSQDRLEPPLQRIKAVASDLQMALTTVLNTCDTVKHSGPAAVGVCANVAKSYWCSDQ